MRSELRVVPLDRIPDKRWDAFVRRHPRATAYHLSAWAEILRSAYRFEPVYLALETEAGALRGVLPLVCGSGLISRPRLVSLPAVRWGGPLGESIEDEAALLLAARRVGDERGVGHIGVRSDRRGYEELLSEVDVYPVLPSWRITLPHDWDSFREDLKGRSMNVLRGLKKAESRPGLEVREAESEKDLRRFHRLYLRMMRAHGALPRRFRQLSVSQKLLGPIGVFKLVIVEHEGRQVAGGIFHRLGEMTECLYQASDDRYLDLRPNHALYGWVIRRSIESGHRYFDFGAAPPGSSLASFKSRWGAEPVERFHYGFHSRENRSPTERSMRTALLASQRGGDSFRRRVWRRTPLPLTRLAGAVVYTYL